MSPCFGIEYRERPLSSVLLALSPSWVMHDPFRAYWHPDRDQSADGLYDHDHAMEAVERVPSFLNEVVLLDRSSLDRDRLRTEKKRHGHAPPDWARRYDYFLDNHRLLSECADLVVFPSLWLSDDTHGNFVLFCRQVQVLEAISAGTTLLPIVPAAVLATWPQVMLDYLRTGDAWDREQPHGRVLKPLDDG
jgi:hypothetical protein